MLVETDVKVKGEAGIGHGSGSSDSSSSSGMAAADASEGTGPPPVPVDTFRHKSLAEVPTDYGPYLTIKGFKINAFGFYFCFMALFWAIPWGVFLILYKASLEYMDKIDPRRYNVDRSSALWGWLTSISTDSLPDISGTENIPKGPAVRVGGKEKETRERQQGNGAGMVGCLASCVGSGNSFPILCFYFTFYI